MPTHNIECSALDNEEIDIGFDLRVWPCCFMQNLWYENGRLDDPYIDSLPKDWNKLDISNGNTVSKILEHRVFTKYLTDKTWASDRCSPVCKHFCQKEGNNDLKINEISNKED